MRTANIDGAHIEYFRGIANPIGVKVGAAMSAGMAAGTRSGAEPAEPAGPPDLHSSIRRQGHRAAAAGHDRGRAGHGLSGALGVRPHARQYRDHGGGVKTRRFDNILGEVEAAFRIHEESGSMLGGVHIELTGEDVTECIGGARGLRGGRSGASLSIASGSPVERGTGAGTRHADCPPRGEPRGAVGETPKCAWVLRT